MEQKLIEDDGTTKIVNHVKARIAEKDDTIAALRAENAKLRDALIELKFQAERRHDEHQLREGLIGEAIKQARRALESNE